MEYEFMEEFVCWT